MEFPYHYQAFPRTPCQGLFMRKILISREVLIELLKKQCEVEFCKYIAKDLGHVFRGYGNTIDIIPDRGVVITLWISEE